MQVAARPVFSRMLHIDQALRAHEWPNARSLGEQLEVCPRTVRRDIDYMRDRLHAPIEYDREKHGFYYSEPSYVLMFPRLTEGELAALAMAERVLNQHRGTPYGADLARLFHKITEMLNGSVRLDARKSSEHLSFRPAAPAECDAGTFQALERAAREHRRIVINYWALTRDERNERAIDPHGLYYREGQWYVVGYCHWRQAMRTFAVGRVLGLRTTDEFFEPDAAFSIDGYLSNTLSIYRGDGTERFPVRLRFTGIAPRFIRERAWIEGQRLETTAEGDLVLSFEVSHLREVERMVLSWLPDCEVLGPLELRASVARAVAQAAEVYGKGDNATKRNRRYRGGGLNSD